MSEAFGANEHRLPTAAGRRVDELADDFEAAWLAGRRPRIDDYLASAEEPARSALLQELIRLEVEYRGRSGEQPTAAEYQARFPDHPELLPAVFANAVRPGQSPPPRPAPPSVTSPFQPAPDGAGVQTAPGEPVAASQEPLPAVPGYEILGVLGHGGMGVVYKARDLRLKRLVALKMIRLREDAASPVGRELLDRLRREAEAVARLQHPHIVQIYDIGENDGLPYLSLEYVDGGSLDKTLVGTPLPAKAAAALVEKLSRAVHAAHQQGVVHRDLKPANVLLVSGGVVSGEWSPDTSHPSPLTAHQPKIADFGLAKRLDAEPGATPVGTVLGTPSYMAPEQAQGRPEEVGPAADVYALGAILYECLTGRPPFRADNAVDTLLQVIGTEPVPPSRLQPRLPRDLDTLCLKCLEKEPRKRYATALDVAEELARFLGGQPIRARPLGPVERGWRWAKRRPAGAALILVSALAVFGLLGLSLWHNARLRGTLYHSLVGQARAIRQARRTGYRHRALDLLQQALALNTAEKDSAELRQEAVACLGDFVGLDPVTRSDFAAEIRALAFAPGAGQLIVGLDNGTLSVRTLDRGDPVVDLGDHRAAVVSVAFDRLGKQLASADLRGTVLVWQPDPAGRWHRVREIHVPPPRPDGGSLSATIALAFAPDGTWLAVASSDGEQISLFNPATGSRMPSPAAGKAGSRLQCLAFSPDGRRLAAGCHRPGTDGILIWDTASPLRQPRSLACPGRVMQVTFSADGRSLAAACRDGGVVLFETGGFERRPAVRGDYPEAVAFHPNNRLLAIAAYQLGVIRLWDVTSDREVAVLDHPGAPSQVDFSADGHRLVAAGARSLRVWDLAGAPERLVLAGHEGGVPAVAFSPDDRLLASAGGDRTVKLWDPATGKQLSQLNGFRAPVETLAFDPRADSRLLATGDRAGEVHLWDQPSGKNAVLRQEHLSQVWSVAFDPTGKRQAVAGQGGLILYDVGRSPVPSARLVRRLATDFLRSVCFSPDGAFLVAAGSGTASVAPENTVYLWNLKAGGPPTILPVHAAGSVRSLAFRGTGRDLELVLIGKALAPQVYGPATRAVTSLADAAPVEGRGTELQSVLALSPDGEWLAQQGRAVRLWDLAARTHLLDLPEDRSLPWSFAWSHDRRLLAVGSADGGVVVWDLHKLRSELARLGLDW
jgi:serine/threonine protein kinase/WD40 repeat protein